MLLATPQGVGCVLPWLAWVARLQSAAGARPRGGASACQVTWQRLKEMRPRGNMLHQQCCMCLCLSFATMDRGQP